LKDTRYYPLEKYRRSRRGRKWNKYTFGLYIYIYFSIPSPRPLSLCRIHSLSVTPSHTPPPTISHSFCLHRRLLLRLTRSLCFIFILYIDTKLSPPVNKYRQQWPPKGGSFSYFNASSWSYPSTVLHTAVHVYTTRLFVHYAFTGQCRGSKRSSRSSVHFFSHFFIYSLLFFFARNFLARCTPLSLKRIPHLPLIEFYFSHNRKPNHTNFCVCLVQHFCKTYLARRSSLPDRRLRRMPRLRPRSSGSCKS